MATRTRPIDDQPRAEADPAEADPVDRYDRSSLVGEFMVMIAGQTEEEYFRRAPESRTCEFIDGIVYMPSPADAWHQFDIQLLVHLLDGFTGVRQSGIVLTGPNALRLRPDCHLEPDVFVLPFGGNTQIHGPYCDPPALLVIEVLSQSTRSHDLKAKSALYQVAGVPEILFVDGRDHVLIVQRLTAEGYVTENFESGPFLSRVIPGFWFEVSWLWARPRPAVKYCLDEVLDGPPT